MISRENQVLDETQASRHMRSKRTTEGLLDSKIDSAGFDDGARTDDAR